MDIKHVLSVNPLAPGVPGPAARTRSARPSPRLGRARRAAWSRSATTATASPSTTSARAQPNGWSRSPWPTGSVTNGEWLAFVDDGGYRRPELWLSDGWGAVQASGGPGAALLALARRRGWTEFTLAGAEPLDPTRPVVPRQLLRGRRLRPLGRRPAAHRGRVGGASRPTRPVEGREPRPRDRLRPKTGPAGRPRASSATSGSGPARPTCRTPASGPPPGRSVSTTGSSWSSQHVLRGGLVRHARRATSGRPTGTSSRRAPSGRSPGCGWPGDERRRSMSATVAVDVHLAAPDWAAP